MLAETLNSHIAMAVAATRRHERVMAREVKKAIDAAADEAARNFKLKVTDFNAVTAAAVKGKAIGLGKGKAASWYKPHPDEVLSTSKLNTKIVDAVGGGLNLALKDFAAQMPKCVALKGFTPGVTPPAQSGPLPATVDRVWLGKVLQDLDAAKAAGASTSQLRPWMNEIRKGTGMSPTAARKALEAEQAAGGSRVAPKIVEAVRSRPAVAKTKLGKMSAPTAGRDAERLAGEAYTQANKLLGILSDRHSAVSESGRAKDKLVTELARRLEGNPDWETLASTDKYTRVGSWPGVKDETASYKLANEIVQKWAASSADHDAYAIALQRATAEEFNLAPSSYDSVFVGRAATHYGSRASLKRGADEIYAERGAAYRAFARAMYDITQEKLKSSGYKGDVILYRGVGHRLKSGAAEVSLQPLSSFSASLVTAAAFGSESVLATLVPVERIISTAITGIGCLDEREFVVLGAQAGGADTVVSVSGRNFDFYGHNSRHSNFVHIFWEAVKKHALTGAGALDEPARIDELDGDWIKRGAWDITTATDAGSLCAWLAWSGMTPESFRTLDVYRANVSRLGWLAEWTGCDDNLTASIDDGCGPSATHINWETTNQYWAKVYTRTGDHIDSITQKTRADVMRVIDNGYQSGASIPEVAQDIRATIKGSSQGRADTIARCLPGETPIDAAVVLAATRRWYEGDMVVIVTESGREFTATPNHPMLTSGGWYGAGEVHKGDHLVGSVFEQDAGSWGDVDVAEPPATIAEVFEALDAVGVSERRTGSQPDFHGDGIDGDVDIATAYRELRIGRFAPLHEHVVEELFAVTDESRAAFCCLCGALLSIDQQLCFCRAASLDSGLVETVTDHDGGDSQRCGDTGNALAIIETLNDSVVVEMNVVRGGAAVCEVGAARVGQRSHHSSRFDGSRQDLAVDPRLDRDPACAEPGQIELDGVVEIRRFRFAGHVYNLSTPYGYFLANGAYTGNTEMNRLQNGASLSAAQVVSQAAGVGYMKRWLTAPGAEHPRHEDYDGLDGQTVGIDDMFDVGGNPFSYPGDPDGDPGDSINCRCAISFIDQEDHPVSSGVDLPDMAASAFDQPVVAADADAELPSPGMKLTSVSARRHKARGDLTASGAAPLQTNFMLDGSLAARRFYELFLASGHADLAFDMWPCDIHGLGEIPNQVLRDGEEAVIALDDGALALVTLHYGWFHVRVCAPTAETAAATVASFRNAYPASYLVADDDRVPITFWTYGKFGPEPRLRKIDSASWGQIERNYTADVRGELGSLMSLTDPGKDGQLILWQGTPGTGKTWALRALASEWASWAEFHYITDPDAFFVSEPSYMINVLLSDSYSAIDHADGKAYEEEDELGKWRVLILEDTGELLSATAKKSYGQGLSRLLNVVDGMIGQGLRVLALVTTNDELGDLHPAVTRPGRCASQIEFGPLTAEEASEWLGETTDAGGTLAELYARSASGAEALPGDTLEDTVTAAADTEKCANCSHYQSAHAGADNMGACSMKNCDCGGYEAAALSATPALVAPITATTSGGNNSTFHFNGELFGYTGSSSSTFVLPVPIPEPVEVIPPSSGVEADVPETEQRTNASLARWHAKLAPEGKATDDGRIFAPGSIGWRDLPLSLMAMKETPGEGGHAGAQLAGRIDSVYRNGDSSPVFIEADGVFNDDEIGAEIAGLVEEGFLTGNSVDLAVTGSKVVSRNDVVDADGFWLDGVDIDEVAQVSVLDIFFGEVAAADVLFVITEAKIGMSTVCPFPAFADATISVAASGARQAWTIFQGVDSYRVHVHVDNSFRIVRQDDLMTASAAGIAPVLPPEDWFADPQLDDWTPLTITDEGHVYGHAWTWGECHIGLQDACTVAPHSDTGYAYFLLKEVETAEGGKVEVGTITLDTNHAGRQLGWRDAAAHYDHTGTATVDVAFGEDEYGGWFSGALRPDVTVETVRKLRGASVSGDWRKIHGNLELVGLLAVNVPGFPIPRTRALVAAAESGVEVLTLIAAGIPEQKAAPQITKSGVGELRALAAKAGGGLVELMGLALRARR